jgi:acyl-coenzyme A synthetase/AMP-(fatty) acid ligase
MLATSGTTGAPKRIALRPDTWHATLTAGARKTTSDVVIQYSPLAHIAGALTISGTAVRGDRVVLLEKFSVDGWLDAVRRYRPKNASLPPTMMRMVMDADPDPADLSSVEVVMSGQAPVDWALARAFEERYGVVVCGNYGATEFCGPIAAGSAELRRHFGDAKWGSVGRLRRDLADARIIDPQTGAELPAGRPGVLEVKVFRIGPDWMRTSDLARLDADDFLYIEGRADDAIIRGGFKIVPGVVADALRAFPGVADVGVAGLPDTRLGAVPAAAVEMKPGAAVPAEAELIAFARSRLLAYQAPVAVKVVDALPRTPTLKVDRRALVALLQAKPIPAS